MAGQQKKHKTDKQRKEAKAKADRTYREKKKRLKAEAEAKATAEPITEIKNPAVKKPTIKKPTVIPEPDPDEIDYGDAEDIEDIDNPDYDDDEDDETEAEAETEELDETEEEETFQFSKDNLKSKNKDHPIKRLQSWYDDRKDIIDEIFEINDEIELSHKEIDILDTVYENEILPIICEKGIESGYSDAMSVAQIYLLNKGHTNLLNFLGLDSESNPYMSKAQQQLEDRHFKQVISEDGKGGMIQALFYDETVNDMTAIIKGYRKTHGREGEMFIKFTGSIFPKSVIDTIDEVLLAMFSKISTTAKRTSEQQAQYIVNGAGRILASGILVPFEILGQRQFELLCSIVETKLCSLMGVSDSNWREDMFEAMKASYSNVENANVDGAYNVESDKLET